MRPVYPWVSSLAAFPPTTDRGSGSSGDEGWRGFPVLGFNSPWWRGKHHFTATTDARVLLLPLMDEARSRYLPVLIATTVFASCCEGTGVCMLADVIESRRISICGSLEPRSWSGLLRHEYRLVIIWIILSSDTVTRLTPSTSSEPMRVPWGKLRLIF